MTNAVLRYRDLADYNAWANARLYAAARSLSPADFHADLGAFFLSVCGTLNHLLVTDRIWLARLSGTAPPADPLNTILYAQIDPLWNERRTADARLISLVTDLAGGDLNRRLKRDLGGCPPELPRNAREHGGTVRRVALIQLL